MVGRVRKVGLGRVSEEDGLGEGKESEEGRLGEGRES